MITEETREEYLTKCEVYGVDEKGLGGFDQDANECHTCEMQTPDMHGACKAESEAGKKLADEPVKEKEEVDIVTEEKKPVEKKEDVKKEKPKKEAAPKKEKKMTRMEAFAKVMSDGKARTATELKADAEVVLGSEWKGFGAYDPLAFGIALGVVVKEGKTYKLVKKG